MWALEKRLLGTAERMVRGNAGAVVPREIRERILAGHPDLSAEQAAAVRSLTDGSGALRGLSGVAGAGKTRSTEVTREIFEAAGYRVIGGALSGAAKEELAAQAKVPSRTIASYLHELDRSTLQKVAARVRHDVTQLVRAAAGKPTKRFNGNPLDTKTVLILDEAGMIDTRLMQKLLRYAEKAGATVILAGDSRQLQPIGAGAPFRHLQQRIPMATLETNRRQKSEADRRAVGRLRQGEAKEALENYS
ncbi:MAG: AAA family ATPase, partial [Planctomyces sp.]